MTKIRNIHKDMKHPKCRPGTVSARFNYLMSELMKRFEINPFAGPPPELEILEKIDSEQKELNSLRTTTTPAILTYVMREYGMVDLNVYDKVAFVKTGDDDLDNQIAIVLGFYEPDGIIVQPTPKIEGYAPALVITKYCLQKV